MNELRRFTAYLQFEKRFSRHTITAYTTDLKQFFSFLEEQYQVGDTTAINHLFIRSWLVSQIENKITPRSINRKITCLRTFFRFMQREKIITVNPMLKIQAPKTSKRLPEFIDEKRMDVVLDHKVEEGKKSRGEGDSFAVLRNHVLLEFFYMTGVRLSEIINLRHSDVNLYNLSVRVMGKRNKERQVPITGGFKKTLESYLEKRTEFLASLGKSSDFIFINDKGNQMYPRFVYRVVRGELMRHAEITNTKKSPHLLRHSFATAMLNKGADINAIKELLGHSNLSATQVYTHNTIEKLKDIYKQAFPKA